MEKNCVVRWLNKVCLKAIALKRNKSIIWFGKVFCIYPLTRKQFETLLEPEKRDNRSLEEFLESWGIEPGFKKKLKDAGIAVRSLVRKPEHIKGNKKFLQEAAKTRGNFLLQCFAGRHISGAYAMFYLAAASKLSLQQIREVFVRSGRGEDLGRIERALKDAGINLEEVVKAKEARTRKKAYFRRASARRKEVEKRKLKRKR